MWSGVLDYKLQTSYTLEVTATNIAGVSAPVALTINIANIIDDEPVLNSANFSLTEDTSIGTIVGVVEVTVTGSSAITAIKLSGNGSQKFSIDLNGTVKLAQTLDYETQKVYQLNAIATNAKADSVAVDVEIEVSNIPEHVPVLKAFVGSVVESAEFGTVIGTIQEDKGGDSPITSYQLSDTGVFDIDSLGTITLIGVLDYEQQTHYILQATATNSAGSSSPVNVQINIRNIPDGEPVLDDFIGATEENATIGTVVGQLTVLDDGDTPIDSYRILGEHNDTFTIDVETQEVILAQSLDFEQQPVYHLIYKRSTVSEAVKKLI